MLSTKYCLYSSYYYCILLAVNLVSKKLVDKILLHDGKHLLTTGVILRMQTVGVHSL